MPPWAEGARAAGPGAYRRGTLGLAHGSSGPALHGRGGAEPRVRRGVSARRAVHPHALVGPLNSELGGTREGVDARPGEGCALNVFAPVTSRLQESSEDFLRVLARGGRGTAGEARPRRTGRACCWPPPAWRRAGQARVRKAGEEGPTARHPARDLCEQGNRSDNLEGVRPLVTGRVT